MDQEVARLWRPLAVSGRTQHSRQAALQRDLQLVAVGFETGGTCPRAASRLSQRNFDFFSSPRGIGQSLGDVRSLQVGIVAQISSRVRPAVTSPTIVPTVTRIPRMHGLPPITVASRVMRVSSGMAELR